MSRDKAIKAVQRLIRLYLSKHGYHVEQTGRQWQWRHADEVTLADDELAATLAAAEALIRNSVGARAA